MSFDFAKWDHLHDEGSLLRERLASAWLTSQQFLRQRQQLIERHQELVLQRQRLVERHEDQAFRDFE